MDFHDPDPMFPTGPLETFKDPPDTALSRVRNAAVGGTLVGAGATLGAYEVFSDSPWFVALVVAILAITYGLVVIERAS